MLLKIITYATANHTSASKTVQLIHTTNAHKKSTIHIFGTSIYFRFRSVT